jgi:hypothetical protein
MLPFSFVPYQRLTSNTVFPTVIPIPKREGRGAVGKKGLSPDVKNRKIDATIRLIPAMSLFKIAQPHRVACNRLDAGDEIWARGLLAAQEYGTRTTIAPDGLSAIGETPQYFACAILIRLRKLFVG